LVSPKVAETLANEAGVHVVVLATLEGVSQDELDAGQDYRSIMRSDLRTLRTALGCS
jgi:zinc transport system substrate-binding protein